jgi:hypothetical protein
METVNYDAVIMDLRQKLANIETERTALEAKEAALKSAIEQLKKFRALESGTSAPSAEEAVFVPKKAYKNCKTVISAIRKYLEIAQRGQGAPAIAEGLIKGGWQANSKHFKANVRTALYRYGDTHGVVHRKDMWWLEEWPYTPPPDATIDPFSGSGTTLVAGTGKAINDPGVDGEMPPWSGGTSFN